MNNAVIVVSFEATDDRSAAEVFDQVREGLVHLEGVVVYMAIRDAAEQVIDIFKPGGPHA